MRDDRDNTLAYMDQASLLGLRALGHGPLIQFIWVYRRGADRAGLQRFQRNLGSGLLGRRIERSPLPGGRHRWIDWPEQSGLVVCPDARPTGQLTDWADEQAALSIDPEYGPPWRLAVLPLSEGGSAVTLVVSHTVADGVGAAIAVTDAVRGVGRDLHYPAPGSRTKTQAVLQDSRQFLNDLPELFRAAAAAVRLARHGDTVPRTRTGPAAGPGDGVSVRIPSAAVHVDTGRWDRRAAQLGGTSNSLVMAFAARLGLRLGWVPPGSEVVLSVPVSERRDGDTRGNALAGVRVSVDPETVVEDLAAVRSELKSALAAAGDPRNELLGPLPLIPLTPKFVARRIERMIVGSGVVGCSNVGDLDPAVNRPDGTDADSMWMRLTENLNLSDLRRSGGAFFPVGSGRVGGRIFISAGYTDADGSATRGFLVAALERVLDDIGVEGAIT